MIIGIDANEANTKRRVGIGEFAYEIIRRVTEQKEADTKYVLYLKNKPLEDLPIPAENLRYKIFGPSKFWTQIALPINLFTSKPKPDVFFSPSHYAPRFSPCPTVVSVMDVSYLHFPELFKKSDLLQLRNWTKYSVLNARKVITISKSSKDDIIEEYGIAPEKVVVIYPGIKPIVTLEPHVYLMSELRIKHKIDKKYVLYVGTLQPRKNVERLIQAFAKLAHEDGLGEKIELVLVGKKGWLYEDILRAPEKYDITSRVKFLDYVTDDELMMLYKEAECFVLPSLYEGFGLPILEAMKYGCPVITSNVSSMPEAGGDAAVYIDPENVDDIAEKLKKVLNDGNLRRDMIEKGKNQVKKFSWDASAKKTLEILREVAA